MIWNMFSSTHVKTLTELMLSNDANYFFKMHRKQAHSVQVTKNGTM